MGNGRAHSSEALQRIGRPEDSRRAVVAYCNLTAISYPGKETAVATLHVRNVPDDLYQQIRGRAETSSRSLSAEVVVLLRGALQEERPSVNEILADIHRRRFRPAPGAPDSTTLLREDRER